MKLKISICLLISMLFTMMSSFVITNAATQTVIQLNDSAAWSGDANKVDTVGAETTITGETGVVYSGLNLTNEWVEFKMQTNVSDGWVGLKFRSDLPFNAPWDNKTGYFILIKAGSAQLMRQGTLESLADAGYPAGANPADGAMHKITAGVTDSVDGNSVNITFKVDDVTVLSFSDTDQEKMSKGSSAFSIFQYGKTTTKIEVYANENSTCGGIVNRTAPAASAVITTEKNWFVNNTVGMGINGGDYTTLQKTAQKAVITGRGGATFNESLSSSVYSFDLSVKTMEDPSGSSGVNGNTIVLFRKQDRNSPTGKNAYGVRFTPNGSISLVSYNNDKAKIFPAYKTGLDFTGTHHFIVEVIGDISGDQWFSDVYIYVDDNTKAYKYRDNSYNPNLEPPAFFGLVNSDVNVVASISNIKHNGSVEEVVADEELYPVYFADVIVENGNSFLHWEWRPDGLNYTKAIISTKNGKILGETEYPFNTFSLNCVTGYDKLYVSAVNADGKRAEPIEVDLTRKSGDLAVENPEKIIIKETDQNAGFFTKDSNQPFIPNGVNYVGIRFGDHATFEPEYGLIPSEYDPYSSETLMKTLKINGYNMIRVFIIPGGRQSSNLGLGGISLETEGLYIPYMECFMDFLSRANKYGIYVMPTFGENEMVSNKFFTDLANNGSGQGIFFSKAGIKAKQQYLKWFLEYIKTRNPELMNSVIALEMQNEFAFNSAIAPFNQVTGTYTFMDGTKFDMTKDDDRRNLANAAIVNYYKEMKKAIREVVPDMLLTEGTYSMLAVGKNFENAKGLRAVEGVKDTRIPMSAPELLATEIDFLDFHVYRYGQSGTASEVFEKNLVNMKFDTDDAKNWMKKKPVILGEYGAFSADPTEGDLESGMNFAKGLRDSAVDNGFAGALLWTMDTFEQTEIWCLMWDNGSYLPFLSLLKQDGTVSTNWDDSHYLNVMQTGNFISGITAPLASAWNQIVAMAGKNKMFPVLTGISFLFVVLLLLGCAAWVFRANRVRKG